MSVQIPNLTNLAEGLKKNIKGISSAFLKLEFSHPKTAKDIPVDDVAQRAIQEALPKSQAGLLVTGALEDALQSCKKRVETIAKQCRLTNRRFRDIEFDLEKDQFHCRFGLEGVDGGWSPSAVKRVTDIFDKPVFFGPEGPNASDVRQGALGDCWFLAALSAISTIEGLVEKICVARDEEVGVYGFVFFRDCVWKTIIIDDLLLWSMPKYDELNPREKALYHNERETYHNVVEKSGKGLLYARSGTVGETWVPLIEKAFAKLHGDYAALEGGFLSEGIEDLTGGVASSFQMSDLLSTERFWTDELQHADTHTRLFGVGLTLNTELSGIPDATVQGLWPAHAYSVLRARECRGKRFVVVRNPWGNSEWTGAWADGAKEWKGEWLGVLGELGHEFGDDGQFVMEYSDFLSVFQLIDRATLFDSSWIMSSYWLCVPPQPALHPWTYGDAYYYVKLDKASSTVIVLAQTDDRYIKGLHGDVPMWFLDFLVYDKESKELVGVSGISLGSQRSVSCEVHLEAGEYIVLPRVEPMDRGILEYNPGPGENAEWSRRKLSRVLAERAESRLLAANYEVWQEIDHIPRAPEVALEVDLKRVEPSSPKVEPPSPVAEDAEKKDTADVEAKPEEKAGDSTAAPDAPEASGDATIPKAGDKAEETTDAKPAESAAPPKAEEATGTTGAKPTDSEGAHVLKTEQSKVPPPIVTIVPSDAGSRPGSPGYGPPPQSAMWGMADPLRNPSPPDSWAEGPLSQALFLGLRVYTQDGAVAIVSGRLKEVVNTRH